MHPQNLNDVGRCPDGRTECYEFPPSTGNKNNFCRKICSFCIEKLIVDAQMAELVDALVSGTSVSNDVQVRVLFWAQKNSGSVCFCYIFVYLQLKKVRIKVILTL